MQTIKVESKLTFVDTSDPLPDKPGYYVSLEVIPLLKKIQKYETYDASWYRPYGCKRIMMHDLLWEKAKLEMPHLFSDYQSIKDLWIASDNGDPEVEQFFRDHPYPPFYIQSLGKTEPEEISYIIKNENKDIKTKIVILDFTEKYPFILTEHGVTNKLEAFIADISKFGIGPEKPIIFVDPDFIL